MSTWHKSSIPNGEERVFVLQANTQDGASWAICGNVTGEQINAIEDLIIQIIAVCNSEEG